MALKLGELVAFLKTDNSQLDRGLAEGEAATRAAGRRMARDADDTGRSMGAGIGAGGGSGGERFVRDALGRLRGSHGRFASEGGELGQAAASGVGGGFAAAVGTLSMFTSGISAAAGGAWAFVPALSAVLGIVVALIPAVGVLGGALGSLPGLMAGLSGVVGVLGLGFMGLDDAFKKTGSSGGGAAKSAADLTQKLRAVQQATQEVARSERDVADAQKAAAQATRDVAAAVEEETERRAQLNRDLRSSELDVKDAIREQTQAKRELDTAQRRGALPQDIDRFKDAYERTVLAVENSKAKVQELGAEQKKAATTTVKQSDLVVAARDRQAMAERRVTDAIQAEQNAVQRLGDAQKALHTSAGGGGGAAGQVTKLAPAAAAAVAEIKRLKPAFDSLRLDVQQKLFAGVGGEIKTLAHQWIPTLHGRLGSIATMLNGLFGRFTKSIGTPQFIADIDAGMASTEGLVDRVGRSVTDHLIPALGQLSADAGPFITELGNDLGGMVDDFGAWIDSAHKSGALQEFFKKASGFLHDVFHIGKDVVSIIGSLFDALFSDPKGTSPWESLQKNLDELAAWFKDPANQEKVVGFFNAIGGAIMWLGKHSGDILGLIEVLGPLVGVIWLVVAATAAWSAVMALSPFGLIAIGIALIIAGIVLLWKHSAGFRNFWIGAWNLIKSAALAVGRWFRDTLWGSWIKGTWNSIISKGTEVVNWFKGLPGKIKSALGRIAGFLSAPFRNEFNQIASFWNRTVAGMHFTVPSWIPLVGGKSFSIPRVPQLAKGAIVPATPGGRLVNVAEGGQDEAVIPLSKLAGMLGTTVLELRSSGSRIDDFLVELLRTAIKGKGGNVQKVLGQN